MLNCVYIFPLPIKVLGDKRSIENACESGKRCYFYINVLFYTKNHTFMCDLDYV